MESARSIGDHRRGRAGPAGRGGERRSIFVVKTLVVVFVVFIIATFPATWLLMLFLGNVDSAANPGPSYWGTLPLGVLVSGVLAGVSGPRAIR
jgi:hypothetical protein